MDSYSLPYTCSQRAQQLTSSTIREILKVTERPEIIACAGCRPSPRGFPVDVINKSVGRVMQESGESALQQRPTEGYAPCRAWVSQDVTSSGADVSPDEVMFVSGSQQALDM